MGAIENIGNGGGYYQNSHKAHYDLLSHVSSSAMLRGINEEVVEGGFDGVLSRVKHLLEEDEIKNIDNPVNNISTEALFKTRQTLVDNHGSCSSCGFAFEHCHC